MNPGDRFIWLHSESDPKFGIECVAVAIRKDKLDYQFVGKDWGVFTMPLDWAVPKKHYSPEEISAIQKRRKRRRVAEKF